MSMEFVVCPECKQKLGVIGYVAVGSSIVCANPRCNTTLRVVQRAPIRVVQLTERETLNADARPEAYG